MLPCSPRVRYFGPRLHPPPVESGPGPQEPFEQSSAFAWMVTRPRSTPWPGHGTSPGAPTGFVPPVIGGGASGRGHRLHGLVRLRDQDRHAHRRPGASADQTDSARPRERKGQGPLHGVEVGARAGLRKGLGPPWRNPCGYRRRDVGPQPPTGPIDGVLPRDSGGANPEDQLGRKHLGPAPRGPRSSATAPSTSSLPTAATWAPTRPAPPRCPLRSARDGLMAFVESNELDVQTVVVRRLPPELR